MEFYTYILKNPLKNMIPFYVGKGKDNRAFRHFKSVDWKESTSNPHKKHIIKQIKESGLVPEVEIFNHISEQEAFEHEKILIQKYKRSVDGGVLTNICLGGEGASFGHKKVKQFSLFREFIKVHNSILEAALEVGTSSSSIVQACKKQGPTKTPKNFVWCYYEDEPDWDWCFVKKTPVFQWTIYGELLGKYNNINQLSKIMGYDSSTIKSFIKNVNSNLNICKLPYGFVFTSTPTFKHPNLKKSKRCKKVICLEHNLVFESCSEAAKFVVKTTNKPCRSSDISSVCNNKQKTCRGFTWKYY